MHYCVSPVMGEQQLPCLKAVGDGSEPWKTCSNQNWALRKPPQTASVLLVALAKDDYTQWVSKAMLSE